MKEEDVLAMFKNAFDVLLKDSMGSSPTKETENKAGIALLAEASRSLEELMTAPLLERITQLETALEEAEARNRELEQKLGRANGNLRQISEIVRTMLATHAEGLALLLK